MLVPLRTQQHVNDEYGAGGYIMLREEGSRIEKRKSKWEKEPEAKCDTKMLLVRAVCLECYVINMSSPGELTHPQMWTGVAMAVTQ